MKKVMVKGTGYCDSPIVYANGDDGITRRVKYNDLMDYEDRSIIDKLEKCTKKYALIQTSIESRHTPWGSDFAYVRDVVYMDRNPREV